MSEKLVVNLQDVGIDNVNEVGGKNASLGEMIKNLTPKGIKVPGGFAVTAEGYRHFLRETKLDEFIKKTLDGLDTKNLTDLSARALKVREAIKKGKFPKDLEEAIVSEYKKLEELRGKNVDVAVRSSATAEDLPGASFAGEQETYLGIRGAKEVLVAAKATMASLFTARAISYRTDKGFDHDKIALSVGVEIMVHSGEGASGVMFTLDTESGFKDSIVINGSWGLGEMIVQGEVSPDEYLVAKQLLGKAPKPIIFKKLGEKADKMIYTKNMLGIRPLKIVKTTPAEREKFVLSDDEILTLASWGKLIEEHYTAKHNRWTPMDTEWAKDGKTNELFIVQARPETIHAERDFSKIKEYILQGKGEEIVKGVSVGNKIATGKVHIIMSPKQIGDFKQGEILVTDITDPDWEPIMKMASAIITDKGGRTSHAAIVSRELGIPAVVGAATATKHLKNGEMITVDTSGAEGFVYRGELKFDVREHDLKSIPKPKTKIMMNIGTPDTAFEKSFLPNEGVGLAREEFIISSEIGIHPNALIDYAKLDEKLKHKIGQKTHGWKSKTEFYIDNLAYGIAKIGTAFYPKPVIVRFSDFKTNEYRTLLGGDAYEPKEENPMIGWRGASRYYDPKFKDAFKLEVAAFKKVREEMGLSNVVPMVPFCRTPEEGRKTLESMKEGGLVAKSMGGDVLTYVMCEIPSNILLADEFLAVFDGMSIGSNDLTQLVLGLDRDSGIVAHVANEKNEAVKKMIAEIIKICKEKGKYIGICGQAPSDHKDFALFLVEHGIESMSLNPDTVVATTVAIAEQESKMGK